MSINQIKLPAAWAILISMSIALLIEASFPSTVPQNDIPHLDKLLHFIAYGTLAWLTAYTLTNNKLARGNAIYLISLTYILILGISTEAIQSITPGRDADIADIMANLLGAVFFLFLFKQIYLKA